ncbi:glycosyltransferase [Helicobacter fennelliae]|uniref:Glycosyltransferase n=2 Tax=Helicobacter TaxID=209 RepID=A0A2X3B0E9_9HELI|nr:glycosyltransferase [Helicobacter fennelliae]SQB97502.1 glycosyltransferase [Helicobacter fennelliae]
MNVSKAKYYCLIISAVLLACCIALLPLSLSYISLKPLIQMLYIALGLFLISHIKDIDFREFKAIWFPLACVIVVIIVAYISLHWAYDVKATKDNIRHYLLEPSLFMIVAYLIMKRLDSKGFKIFFTFLCIGIFIQPLATIYSWFVNGGGHLGYRATGFGNPQELVYSFVLLLAFSLSLAFVWGDKFTTKLKGFKILGIILCIISILGICANNSRGTFIAALVALIAPFFILHFRHRIKLLASLIVLLCVFGGGIYHLSAKWDDRYNFKKMVDNFSLVWSYAPAEMGRFDKLCFGTFVTCSNYSGKKPDPNLSWESSSLNRIAMNKSTLLAIAQNPFRPNGFGFLEYYKNIQAVFPRDSLNHPYVLSIPPLLPEGYWHPHNQILSLLFELGIIGFVAIGLFCIYLLIPLTNLSHKSAYKRPQDLKSLLYFGLSIFLITLSVAMLTDCLVWRWNNLYLFLLFGILLAYRPKKYITFTQKPHIYLTFHDMTYRWTERVVANMANAFASRGYQVSIINYCKSNAEIPFVIDNRVRIIFLSNDPSYEKHINLLSRIKFNLKINALLESKGKNILISNYTYFYPYIKKSNTRYIRFFHFMFDWSFYKFRKPWYKRMFFFAKVRFYDVLVVLSTMEIELYKRVCTHVVVIPNFLPQIPDVLTDYSQKRILSVGRIETQKGFDRLIELYATIAKQYPQWELAIVGDGHFKQQYIQRVQEFGMQDFIKFYPFTNDVQKEYLNASIYVMTSRFEGLPMVLLESMSYGLPSIAYDVATGPRDIIQNNVSGFLIKDNDKKQFIKQLQILMQNEKLRARIGANAHKRIKEHFSQEAVIAQWEALFLQLFQT